MTTFARTALALGPLFFGACSFSSHPVGRAGLGTSRSSADLFAVLEQPGPVDVESIASADWAVDRSGVINLDHPRAREAGLSDGDEPIQIFFHVIRHPTKGTFIVDTGVELALRDDPDHAALRGPVAMFMHREKMAIKMPLGQWLSGERSPLAGVFLTHMHLDHISGMPDVPKGTPIFAGPGETTESSVLNVLVRPNIDRALEGQRPIQEWQFTTDAAGRFEGVIDVFGDASLWALAMPGHTHGSTAYVARTPKGPVLLTGDTCHTAWGWEHDVEPGTFTSDHAHNVESLAKLRQLVREHPSIDVRLGHQTLKHTGG